MKFLITDLQIYWTLINLMRGKSWPTCHVTTMPSRAQCRLIMALQKSWCALKIVIAPTLYARLTFLTHSVEKIIWQAIFLRQQKTIQNMLNLTRIWFTMFKIMQKVSFWRKKKIKVLLFSWNCNVCLDLHEKNDNF